MIVSHIDTCNRLTLRLYWFHKKGRVPISISFSESFRCFRLLCGHYRIRQFAVSTASVHISSITSLQRRTMPMQHTQAVTTDHRPLSELNLMDD